MSSQPEADEAPVDLTAGAGGPPRRPASWWSDPRRRPTLILGGIAGALGVVVLLLLLSRGSAPPPEEIPPTPGDLAIYPVRLTLGGTDFEIKPIVLGNGEWRVGAADADAAQWLYGTVVNYIIGLYPTDEIRQVIDDLPDNALITLAMNAGYNLYFHLSGRQRVPAESVEALLQQTRPGMTLIVFGEGDDERLVLTGLYAADEEPQALTDAGLVPVGVPAQLADWRIAVLSGQLAPDSANPAQAAYYVNFVVEYLGDAPTSADAFVMTLIDGVNTEYTIDRAVSQNGAYGPPGGLVAPRNPTSFTAGYRVPANIPGPSLVWEFQPLPDSAERARFEVPIVRPTPTPAPITQITVQINGASLSPDQTLLIISGGVGNPADEPVTITQADISLSTPDNILSDLRAASPPLPWTIQPGQSMAFQLDFTRPPGNTALLRIATHQFQLSGLR